MHGEARQVCGWLGGGRGGEQAGVWSPGRSNLSPGLSEAGHLGGAGNTRQASRLVCGWLGGGGGQTCVFSARSAKLAAWA